MNHEKRMEICADRLKRLRKERGMTQAELGRKTHYSYATVQGAESKSRKRIGLAYLLDMADFFGVTPDYILGYEKNTR